MRYQVLWLFLLLPLPLGSAAAQDPAFRSQAELAREADLVRVAYRDSVDSVRAAYYRTGFLLSEGKASRMTRWSSGWAEG